MSIMIFEAIPSPEEYTNLRKVAGLSLKSIEAAKIGLANSLYTIVIRDGKRLIGMGRVIGDGACFFEIVDIAVDPEYQGHGFGKKIMLKIEKYLENSVMEGSYVSMIADKPDFYKKLNYKLTSPEAYGMYKRFTDFQN